MFDENRLDILIKPSWQQYTDPESIKFIEEALSYADDENVLIDILDQINNADKSKDLITQIDKLSLQNYNVLMTILPNFKNRHGLDLQAITAILEKGFEFSRQSREDDIIFDTFRAVTNAEDIVDDSEYLNNQKLSMENKVWLVTRNLYAQYPQEIDEMWSYIASTLPQTNFPLFLKIIKQMNATPEVSFRWKTSARKGLQLSMGTFSQVFEDMVKSEQKMSPQSRFNENVAWFKFFKEINKDIFFLSEHEARGIGLAADYIRVTQEIYQHNSLLKSYLEHLLGDQIEATDGEFELSDKYKVVFKQGQFIKLVDADTNENVDLDQVVSTKSPERMTEAERQEFYYRKVDFQALTDPFFRHLIQEKLGVDNLSQCDIKVQFWLLDFVKDGDDERFEKIKKFVEDYGTVALQTFLSLEYYQDNGDKIIEIAQHFPDQAYEIFDQYSQLVQQLRIFQNNVDLASELNKVSTQCHLPLLSEQLVAGLSRRTNDIFSAAYQGLQEPSTYINVDSVSNSLQGVAKVLEIVNGLNSRYVPQPYNYRPGPENNTSRENGHYFEFFVDDQLGFDYKISFFIRPQAEFNKQARVNITLGFDDARLTNPNPVLSKAFEQLVNQQRSVGKGRKYKSEISIRIDLDTFDVENPKVTLDLGRNKHVGNKLVRSGDPLGNLLEEIGVGHQDTDSIDRGYAQRDIFDRMGMVVIGYLKNISK